MDIYLLKFSACLLVFWLVYVFLLERQKMHHFKRFYLLGSFAAALIIPLLTITYIIEPVVQNFEVAPVNMPMDALAFEATTEAPTSISLETLLWSIYGLGVLIFSVRFTVNLVRLYRNISKNEKVMQQSFIYVLLKEYRIPHSFFKYIFLNQEKFENQAIPNEVLLHEETHAKQLHSLDIMLVELLQIVFWFHPLVYMLKHHIKLNHEFLADQSVLNHGTEATIYQHILLQFSSNTQDYQLSSAINYSSFKKRFTVMKTQSSKTRNWLSILILVPISAILFFSFAEREYIERENPKEIDTITNEFINYGNSDPVKTYLKKYEVYQKLQDAPPHYIKKPEAVQKQMDDLFSDLGGMYFRLSKANKAKVERPIPPILPYAEITVNGKTYYKKKSELTKEEKATLPPPPQPAKNTKGGPNVTEIQEVYNPSFLEYIIEMEKEGAIFYKDNEKISFEKAKSVAKNDGRPIEMITQRDDKGNYLVKLYSFNDNRKYARSIELQIIDNNSYLINGIKATKKTFLKVINQFHQDISKEDRQKLMNIHVTSNEVVSDEAIWYIYNKLQDYGFYRIVTPNQVVNSAKGNTPFAIEKSQSKQQKTPTKEEIAGYNAWAKKIESESKKLSGDATWYPPINEKELIKYSGIYNRMSAEQKKQAMEYPFPGMEIDGTEESITVSKQEKATKKQIAEYNAWAKKLNRAIEKAQSTNGKSTYPVMKQVEYEKYYHIYSVLMTDAQRKGAEAWPNIPPPPPPPPSPESIKVINEEDIPPPPPPISTLDYVIKMAKQNALFYYESNQVTSDKAIELVKKNPELNVQSKKIKEDVVFVYISKSPIIIGKKKTDELPKIYVNNSELLNPMISLNKKELNKLKLTLSKGEVTSFKLKIPGIKTDVVKGNTISNTSIKNLENLNEGIITIFDIKDDSNNKLPPIVIKLKK